MPTLQFGDPDRPPLVALQGILFSKRGGGKSSARVQQDSPNVPTPKQQQGNDEDGGAVEEMIPHVNSTGADVDSPQKAETPRGAANPTESWLPWSWVSGGGAVQSL